ncbi:MAG TPA: hypothetical protein DD381_14300 [Lentisphaeria bacterium]|nr:MAG: hypothetical protein A2X47_00965 [Lentisphaerae bacterium GWF2_38_69]HBM17496.1 hypothetical protein [Lentisphaeria bacterium]
MKKNYVLISLGLFSLLLASCAPELARTNYGPEEQQWKDYIQKSYKGWEPPQTPAPYSENSVSQSATSTVDAVPEASATIVESPVVSEPVVASEVSGEKVNPENAVSTIPQSSSTYTVQKGDSLWSIAQKIYGNGNSWGVIKEANKDILGNSNSLKAGMVLQIPASGK